MIQATASRRPAATTTATVTTIVRSGTSWCSAAASTRAVSVSGRPDGGVVVVHGDPALHLEPRDRDRLSAVLNDAPHELPGDAVRPLARLRARIPPQVRYAVSIGVVIFLLEYLVLPEVASARRDVHVLGQVNVISLGVAVGLEAAALVAYARSRARCSPPTRRRFGVQLRINMSSLALSHVVPGGTAPGGALAYRLLSDEGVSGSVAAFGLAAQGIGLRGRAQPASSGPPS